MISLAAKTQHKKYSKSKLPSVMCITNLIHFELVRVYLVWLSIFFTAFGLIWLMFRSLLAQLYLNNNQQDVVYCNYGHDSQAMTFWPSLMIRSGQLPITNLMVIKFHASFHKELRLRVLNYNGWSRNQPNNINKPRYCGKIPR